MRLIDADALKHEFAQITYTRFTADMGQGGFEMFSEKEIKNIIDNAPTVESDEITNEDLQAAMTESWHLGYELAETKFKRPKGEWVNKRTMQHDGEFYCSKCEFELESFIQGAFYNFCPNCGADMRKEAEND